MNRAASPSGSTAADVQRAIEDDCLADFLLSETERVQELAEDQRVAALAELGKILFLKQFFEHAAASCEQALQLGPRPGLFILGAKAHARLHRFDTAAGLVAASLKHDPDNVTALRVLAQYHLHMQDHAAAAEVLSRLQSLGTVDATVLLQHIGCLRKTLGDAAARDFMAAHRAELEGLFPAEEIGLLWRGRQAGRVGRPGMHLVYGGNGTGKTTVGRYLFAMGYHIVEMDVEVAGLLAGDRFALSMSAFTRADGPVRFAWPPSGLAHVRERAARAAAPVVCVGWAHNAGTHLRSFDSSYRLYAAPEIKVRRLQARDPKRWAEGSENWKRLFSHNSGPEKRSVSMQIDAAQPVAAIVGSIDAAIAAQEQHTDPG